MMHVGFHVILRSFIDFLNLNDIIYFVDRSGESSFRFFLKILVKYNLFYFWKFNPIALSVQFRFSKQNAHHLPTEISKNMIILNKFSFLNNN